MEVGERVSGQGLLSFLGKIESNKTLYMLTFVVLHSIDRSQRVLKGCFQQQRLVLY